MMLLVKTEGRWQICFSSLGYRERDETHPGETFSVQLMYVRSWPKADIRSCTAHVRFWGQADMTGCGCLLSRSLLGVKQT